jgi:hypothetical protein
MNYSNNGKYGFRDIGFSKNGAHGRAGEAAFYSFFKGFLQKALRTHAQ